MRCSRPRSYSIALPVAVLVALIVMLGAGPGTAMARAQDEGAQAHPAHIHDGSCETLGGIAFPLNDVVYGDMAGGSMAMEGTPAAASSMSTPVAMGEMVGSTAAVPLEMSVTVVDVPLDQIADGQHAINVHKSAEEIDVYIACGDIGGQMLGNMLVIGIGELNDSEEAGLAVLTEMGDQTQVAIFLQDQEYG